MTTTPPKGWPPEAIPRWLSRECAAFYLGGMSPSHFDAQVKAGKLPQPHRFGRLVRFDRFELDRAMAADAGQTEPPLEFPEPKV